MWLLFCQEIRYLSGAKCGGNVAVESCHYSQHLKSQINSFQVPRCRSASLSCRDSCNLDEKHEGFWGPPKCSIFFQGNGGPGYFQGNVGWWTLRIWLDQIGESWQRYRKLWSFCWERFIQNEILGIGKVLVLVRLIRIGWSSTGYAVCDWNRVESYW